MTKGAAGGTKLSALAGGQLTGAIVGGLEALIKQTKLRTLIIVGTLATLTPLAIFFTIILVVSSLLGSTFGAEIAGADNAVATSTGVSASTLTILQNAVNNTPTPWELLAAAEYYETGVGSSVAQQRGVCPPNSGANALCPSTLALEPGLITEGGGPSSAGSAPTTSADSGFDPAVGRNGTVPVTLSADNPDWTTTDTADWDCIRQAESGDNYSMPAGAFGILSTTWASMGLVGTPGQASKAEQNAAALEILGYEGHFYGAWNDLCTQPTSSAATNIAYISPGVADPSSSGTASDALATPSPKASNAAAASASAPVNGGGVCPYTGTKKHPKPHYYGSYCLEQGTGGLSVAQLSDLSQSSVWTAKTVGTSLTKDGQGGIDLTVGASMLESGIPSIDPSNATANGQHKAVLAAFSVLPLEFNSPTMDENIYELAVGWSVGYSPTSSTSCSTSLSAAPASTTIPAPSTTSTQATDLLSAGQVAIANEIVSDASADGASATTQIAALAGALELSNLSTTGAIFGNGVKAVSNAVSAFVTTNKGSASAAPAQDVTALGGSQSIYSNWIPGATQLAGAVGGSTSGCGNSVPSVAGGSSVAQSAIKYAESQLGVPYVWGGETPGQGFDCSGLVQWSFGQAGAPLPRTAEAQMLYVEQYSSLTMNTAQLQPGDLVFFSDHEAGGANHVAIYLGDGNIIQAPETGENVEYYTLAGDMSLGFLGGGPAA